MAVRCYPGTTEQRLIELAKDGNEEAAEYLVERYQNFVRAKARRYFWAGANWDDVVQEGMIGLWKAIRDYKGGNPSFQAFAAVYITHQIVTAIRAAMRMKHHPLNSSTSLSQIIYAEDSDRTLVEVFPDRRVPDPLEVVMVQEDLAAVRKVILEKLSPLERRVLKRYLAGKSYQEIARELRINVKSIDNALGRAKRKLRQAIQM